MSRAARRSPRPHLTARKQRYFERFDEDTRSPQGLTGGTPFCSQSPLRELVRAALTLLTAAGDQHAHPNQAKSGRQEQVAARPRPRTSRPLDRFAHVRGQFRFHASLLRSKSRLAGEHTPHLARTSAHRSVPAPVQPDGIAVRVGDLGVPGGFATRPPYQPRALCALSNRSAPTELSVASSPLRHQTQARRARRTRDQAPSRARRRHAPQLLLAAL